MIKNFAVIQQLDIHFEDGMTVLTGETGAGKSIIIDAVHLLTGGRGSAQFVRHEEEKCQLQGLFTVDDNKEEIRSILQEQGMEMGEDQLLIQRDIYANGRQVSRINGTMATISLLKEVGSYLVDISGQNNQQSLLNADQHMKLLDSFADEEFLKTQAQYEERYVIYQTKKKRVQELLANQQDLNQKLDMLEFQLEELDAAQLQAGEDVTLEKERDQLMNFQKIQQALQQAYRYLAGDEQFSSVDLIGQALEEVSSIEQWGEDYAKISESLNGAYYQLQDIQADLSSALDHLEYDEDALNQMEERLNLIQQLKKKYGPTLDDIIRYHQQAKQEFKELSTSEESLDQWTDELKAMEEELLVLGRNLSHQRRQLAQRLEEKIHRELADLYMEKARFKVVFAKDLDDYGKEDLHAHGLDQLSFYVATNPGEPLKALEAVASGGELSRLMLAIKTLFAEKQKVETNILDEVDTGVSGRVASAIAHKIYSISKQQQVLCITHLPQVAAQADHHLYIAKNTANKRTSTTVRYLEEDDKIQEIAQMLAGEEMSPTALKTAKELRQK